MVKKAKKGSSKPRSPSKKNSSSKKRSKKRYDKGCYYCGKSDTVPLRECRYCGEKMCSDHILPEGHECDGLRRPKNFAEVKEFVSNPHKRHSDVYSSYDYEDDDDTDYYSAQDFVNTAERIPKNHTPKSKIRKKKRKVRYGVHSIKTIVWLVIIILLIGAVGYIYYKDYMPIRENEQSIKAFEVINNIRSANNVEVFDYEPELYPSLKEIAKMKEANTNLVSSNAEAYTLLSERDDLSGTKTSEVLIIPFEKENIEESMKKDFSFLRSYVNPIYTRASIGCGNEYCVFIMYTGSVPSRETTLGKLFGTDNKSSSTTTQTNIEPSKNTNTQTTIPKIIPKSCKEKASELVPEYWLASDNQDEQHPNKYLDGKFIHKLPRSHIYGTYLESCLRKGSEKGENVNLRYYTQNVGLRKDGSIDTTIISPVCPPLIYSKEIISDEGIVLGTRKFELTNLVFEETDLEPTYTHNLAEEDFDFEEMNIIIEWKGFTTQVKDIYGTEEFNIRTYIDNKVSGGTTEICDRSYDDEEGRHKCSLKELEGKYTYGSSLSVKITPEIFDNNIYKLVDFDIKDCEWVT